MFVALPGFSARLTQTASPYAAALHVGPEAAATVAATLLPGAWSYLLLRGMCRAEVVKVWGASGDYLRVQRGQSGTERGAFDVGTIVEYTFTYAEAVDRVSAALSEFGLTIIGASAVTVDGAGEIFNISIPLTAIGVDCTAQVVGENAKLQIGQVIEAYGCCEVRIPSLPPFVYLTSKPYPVDVVEALSTTGIVIDAGVFKAVYEAVATEGQVLDGELRVLLHEYVMVDEAIATEGQVLDGELRVLLHEYSTVDEAIATEGLVLSGDMRNVVISYAMVDEAIATSGLVLSGELLVA